MKKSLIFLIIAGAISIQTNAQCNPTFSGKNTIDTFCVEEIINLDANSPGYSTIISWAFGDDSTSSQSRPSHSYKTAGTYNIIYSGSGTAGQCKDSLTAIVRAIPEIKISLSSADSQCFEGNRFCITDSTIPVTTVIGQSYIFSNGLRIDTLNPLFPVPLCMFVSDPAGGYYDMAVHSADSNGCIAIKNYTNFIYIYPKVDTRFENITPIPNPGCDSTLGRFQNKSSSSIAKLTWFQWDWGDGTTTSGTATSNTQWWQGAANDGKVSHLYSTAGSFDVKLTVIYKTGCVDSFIWENAVANIILKPKIASLSTIYNFTDNPIKFNATNISQTENSSFLWNFGDTASGANNFNSSTLSGVSHSFDLGPHLISLRIRQGICDVTVFDTIQILGPQAKIESVNSQISYSEKNQVGTNYAVRFTNNSLFYHNDSVTSDEDSILVVNGQSVFAFSPTNQTPLTSTKHSENRTMENQVWRVWDFGDEYAQKCTTSTAESINVGQNCNFSTDEFPVHQYPCWDSIYYTDYYLTNDSFRKVTFDEHILTCSEGYIDTSSQIHKSLFDQKVAHNYTAKLWLRDSVFGTESEDEVLIIMTKPNARKLTVSKKDWCEADCTWGIAGSNQLCYMLPTEKSNYVEFDLGLDEVSYFAVNFDSAANPSKFEAWNTMKAISGNIPGKGTSLSNYNKLNGKLPTQFMKGYLSDEIELGYDKTIGLIVGNGSLDANGIPFNLDTIWYHNLLHFGNTQPAFDLLHPSNDASTICAGEAAYYKVRELNQPKISSLIWSWGYNGNGRGPAYDQHIEEFFYLKEYTGPVATRNDKNVPYNGEKWFYNYIVVSKINDADGIYFQDTIVTSIVKDWIYKWEIRANQIALFDHNNGIWADLTPEEQANLYKYWGDGTRGCIDTTGSGSLKVEEHANTFMRGNKKYRYTNATKTDSVEVAHVLHFRDSSLQGYDTLIIGSDTTFGVWKKQYISKIVRNGDTVIQQNSGLMTPSLILTSSSGCRNSFSDTLTVGFMSNIWMENEDDVICNGLTFYFEDSIHYYQSKLGNPSTYPINPYPYWQDPSRVLSRQEYIETDWDSEDGIWDAEISRIQVHFYTKPRTYKITLVAKDSNGCRDTSYFTKEVTRIDVNFGMSLSNVNCNNLATFTDSTLLFSNRDSIISWNWDFGDGTRNSILQNPSHSYTSNGFFEVTLEVKTKSGCQKEEAKLLYIPGPQPRFELDIWDVIDTVSICAGDSLFLINTSQGEITNPTFRMDWGDGMMSNAAPIGKIFSHRYTTPGIYALFLTMEDNIPGTNNRCSRVYPDNNPDIINKHKILVIVNEVPPASISAKTSPTYKNHPTEFTANLDPRYTRMNWNFDGINSFTRTAPDNKIVYQFTTEGTHEVVLSPEYDNLPRCWAKATYSIEVLAEDLNSITDLAKKVHIYPNPTDGQLHVEVYEGLQILAIQLMDIVGRRQDISIDKRNENQILIDARHLANGNYIVEIVTSKGTISKKLTVSKN